MLMKWEDLEPGDVVKINDDIAEFYKRIVKSWVEKYCYKDLEIINVSIIDCKNISIDFSYCHSNRVNYDSFIINRKSGWPPAVWNNEVPLFEIIKLKGD